LAYSKVREQKQQKKKDKDPLFRDKMISQYEALIIDELLSKQEL